MPGIGDCKCVLVIGATSGIGRSLALAIHALPSKPTVLVSGRRQERLDELSKMDLRLKAVRFDVSGSRDDSKRFVQDITTRYPDVRLATGELCLLPNSYDSRVHQLDAVMFSSGIQHIFDFSKPEGIDLNSTSQI